LSITLTDKLKERKQKKHQELPRALWIQALPVGTIDGVSHGTLDLTDDGLSYGCCNGTRLGKKRIGELLGKLIGVKLGS
jgi:hypothetical protein